MIYGAVQFLASDEKKKAIESELVQVFSPVGKVRDRDLGFNIISLSSFK